MTSVLECHGVSKAFDNLVAAAGISFSIGQGEIVGMIGANGAGKTTLLNIVSGYLKPTSGSIIFEGREITGLSSRWINRLGVARSFQIPQLFDGLTCIENLMLARSISAETRWSRLKRFRTRAHIERAREILDEFGVADYAETSVKTLPQGARKLLDMALAMSGAPRLVLLDEPTSGVSAGEKSAIMDRLWASFRKSRMTALFIEHDMELIEKYAERVIALYEGQVIADGAPHEVLRDLRVRQHISGNGPRTH